MGPEHRVFYPRSPGGERRLRRGCWRSRSFFYPRSPGGERPSSSFALPSGLDFLSTLPGRGAAYRTLYCPRFYPFSIHAPREGSGLNWVGISEDEFNFSIHAPREGSGIADSLQKYIDDGFSIHAPREGSGPLRRQCWITEMSFLSTLPGRGAAGQRGDREVRGRVFYPRSPGGERLQYKTRPQNRPSFLSTLPGRGAADHAIVGIPISQVFYPRSPGGERPADRPPRDALAHQVFYPRSPGGERPPARGAERATARFSIHAPREGSGQRGGNLARMSKHFLSTLPGRGAASRPAACYACAQFSIHAPREGSGCTANARRL